MGWFVVAIAAFIASIVFVMKVDPSLLSRRNGVKPPWWPLLILGGLFLIFIGSLILGITE